MAKKWAEVAASDAFKALTPDQQDGARRQYFDQVVAPQVPDEHIDQAWNQFSRDTGVGRRELPAGVKPSTAGGGRGTTVPTQDASAPVEQAATASPLGKSREERIAELDSITNPMHPDYMPVTDNAVKALQTSARGQMDDKRTRTPGRVLDSNIPPLTAGSAAQDVAAGVLQIAPTAVKGVGDLSRMATGDRFGKGISDFAERGNKAIQEVVGSDRSNAQRTRFEQDMADPGMNAADVIVGNPGALADQVLPTVGSMALPVGAAKVADVVVTTGKAAKLARAIDEGTVLARAAKVREGAAIGATVAQNAADTYSTVLGQGGSQEDAYKAAGIAALATAAVGKVTGGGAEANAAHLLSGAKGAAKTIPKAMAKEGIQEVGEEAGQAVGEAVGTGNDIDANAVSKRLAVAGTLGAAMGGGVEGAGAAREARIKDLRGAGEIAAADLLQQQHDKATAAERVDTELAAMPQGNDAFAQHYRGLRSAGVKPAEAAARSAVTVTFQGIGQASGASENVLSKALDATKDMPLDKVPGFLHRYTEALVKRGVLQPNEATAALGANLEAARDEAMDAAVNAVYAPVKKAMGDVLAMEGAVSVNSEPVTQNTPVVNENIESVTGNGDLVSPSADVDLAAHDAATSPLNSLPEPTDAQKAAGNYKVGRVNLHGLNISIENPEGSVRKGTSPDGTKWENELRAHYGYIRGTEGNDGDHVDTFIGPNPESQKVFVVDQVNKDGSFDEHKVMLGTDSLEQADQLYHANYHDGWTGRGAITEMPMAEFKAWVRDGVKTKPLGALPKVETPAEPTAVADSAPSVADKAASVSETAVFDAQSPVPAQHLGRDNVPLSEGGKPFKTRLAADQARSLQPHLRVVRAEGGYALTEKTPAQLAAQEKAAKRLRNPQTSPAGEPIPAHAMIASAGGLAGSLRADMGMQGNVQIGNRKLFAGDGKGLTIEQATEKLVEDGYLPKGASHDQARDLIKRSLTKPQYTAEGTEQMAAVEMEARQQAAIDDAIAEIEALSDNQLEALLDADIPWDEDSNTDTETAMRALGFTEQEIQDAIANQPGEPQDGSASRGGLDESVASQTQADSGRGEESPSPTEEVNGNASTSESQASDSGARSATSGEPTGPVAEQADKRTGESEQGISSSSRTVRSIPDTTSKPAVTQTPSTEGVSVSGFEITKRADGTLAVKGDSAAIREALKDIPGRSLAPMRDGILVGRTQADKAMAILHQPGDLTAPTKEELLAQQERADKAAKEKAAADRAAEKQAALDDDRKHIAKASEAAADTFELGGDALANLTGQQDIFAEQIAAKQEPAKIEDAGEKIGGARKDRWKDRGLDLSDLDGMSESEGAELATKANVWKPDYEAMATATEPVTAAMVKTVYDQLAAQPKKNTPDGRRKYVEMMQIVRKVYTEAKSPDDVKNGYLKVRDLAGLNHADTPAWKQRAREVYFSVYKGRSDPFVLGYNELSKAKKMVELGFPGKVEPWTKRLSLRSDGGSGVTQRGIEISLRNSAELGTPLTEEQIKAGFWRVVDKTGKSMAYLPTKADAEAAAKTIYERDLKKGASEKVEPVRPNLDAMKRENLAKRIDRDVAADDFVKDFGFRGVEFGNWAAQDERQRIINMAYDGLMDLAEIMGVPPKAMSLNGTLGMAFGARGGGKASAHYEPGKLVINMTKLNGGGSMAHEWAHALDHYFGELNQKDAYTTKARGASGWYDEQQYKGLPVSRMEKDAQGKWANVTKLRLDNLRPEMAKAFDGVMSALFSGQATKAEMVRSEELAIERYQALAAKETDAEMKAMYERGVESRKQYLEELRQEPDDKTYPKGRSAYAGEAQKLVGKAATGYWTRPTEMFARAFESWVFDKVAAMGARSDYLVHGVEEDRFAGGSYKGNPYPTGQERATINAAFDKLASTIQTKETDKGVAMFARGAPKTEAFKKWFGDSKVVDADGKPLVVYHGTNKTEQGEAFTMFDAYGSNYGLFGQGAYFTENPDVASSYTSKGRGDAPSVYPAYLSIKNPMDMDKPVRQKELEAWQKAFPEVDFGNTSYEPPMEKRPNGLNNEDFYRIVEEHLMDEQVERYEGAEIMQEGLRSMGHDGITHVGGGRVKSEGVRHQVYIAFDPEQVKSATGNSGNFDPANPDIRYALGADAFRIGLTPRRFMPVSDVQKAVDQLSAKWNDGPAIKVVQSAEDLPVSAPEDARGLIHKGTAYIVAANHLDRAGVARTLAHEAIGHYGLWKMLGDDGRRQFERNIKLALASGNKPLKAISSKVRSLYLDEAGKFNLTPEEEANEIAAFAVEEALDAEGNFKPGFGFLKQVWAKVADFLRGLGFDIKFTNSELQGMLVSAMQGLEAGHRMAGGSETLAAAARSNTPVETQEAIIGNTLGTASQHPDYAAAKAGDVEAAYRVAETLVTDELVAKVKDAIGDAKPIVLPVASVEAAGRNKIPLAASEFLADKLGLKTGVEIGQLNSPKRTSMDGLDRIFNAPEFKGPVEPGASYLLVDDTLTQGATFAALESHIQDGGGYVVGAVALTGKQYSATLRPSEESLKQLRDKLGDIEEDFRAATGYGFGALTQSEVRYLANFKPIDALRVRIIDEGNAARQSAAEDNAGQPPAFARGVAPNLFAPKVWDTPEPTRTDRIIYELQDGRIDLKRVQQAIEKSGQQIKEQWDARLAESLYPGRVAYRSQQFLDTEVKTLLSSMANYKVPMDELADYLHARGAEERNAQVAKVNPDLPDGGAGRNSKGVLMTNDAARDYLAAVTPVRKQVLDALAKQVDAITAGTRKLLVSEGLEKRETIDAWESAYKNYVPMFRDEAQSGSPHPQGTGFTVKGSSSKRATGSTKEVTNILAHVLMQREAAITRAEKNRVALALYGQALSHPNPEFWTTIKPSMKAADISAELVKMGVDPATAAAGMELVPTITTVDPNTGKKVDRPNPMYKSMPGAITLKVHGEDRVLMLNVENERGARLAESLKNLDGLTKLDLASSIVGKATRWLASVNTQYNPAFGLVNLTRDTLGAAVNLRSTALRGNSLKVLAKTPVAILGIARELMRGGQSGKWQTLYRQFQTDGGQTGYKENFRDAGDRAKAIQSELADLQKAGKLTSIPGRVAHGILDLLDGFNTTLENAVRLSAYKAALDHGMSGAEAARLGRELTVDFNRKGRVGREAGPLYAFFNASVQGSARTLQTLNSKDGAMIIAGGVSVGALQALMLLVAGYDDDEVPEFVKSRSLVIPLNWSGTGEKKHILVPYPLGLHVLPNTGRVITELALNGGKEIGKRSFNAIGEIAGAFNPLGGGNIFTADGALKTAAPTIVDPLIEIGFNRNFAGGPIERESNGDADTRPGAARVKESTQRTATGQVYLEISKAINTATGGSDYEAGVLSPTPERVRYLAQTVGGGVLREFEKAINASSAASRGDAVKMSQIPVAGRFYGEVDDSQVKQSRYFDNSRKIDSLDNTRKAIIKAGDTDALEKLYQEHPEAALINLGNKVQSSVAKLNKLAVSTVGDPAAMRDIDATRVETMDLLNQALLDLEHQTKPATPADKVKGWRK